MTDFWALGTGKPITGEAQDAFLKSFPLIPENTIAQAKIFSFKLIEKENQYEHRNDKFYEIIFKLIDGDFKNNEVALKIKPFEGKPESIDRHLNMMKLIMKLCNFKPTHSNIFVDADLLPMINKLVSVKIVQWDSVTKEGKLIEGNRVSEVYAPGSVATETGVLHVVAQPVTHAVDSALQRNNQAMDVPDDSIPF